MNGQMAVGSSKFKVLIRRAFPVNGALSRSNKQQQAVVSTLFDHSWVESINHGNIGTLDFLYSNCFPPFIETSVPTIAFFCLLLHLLVFWPSSLDDPAIVTKQIIRELSFLAYGG